MDVPYPYMVKATSIPNVGFKDDASRTGSHCGKAAKGHFQSIASDVGLLKLAATLTFIEIAALAALGKNNPCGLEHFARTFIR